MDDLDMVILFGAGASYGAGHVRPQAPPLGADLYDALAARYPNEWGSASHLGKMWAAQLRDNFELTMSEEVLPKVPSLSLLEWHRCVAEFFSQYRLDGGGQDMYSRLLSGLASSGLLRRVTLGSLNYDCLLEHAMLGLGLTVDYMLGELSPKKSIPLVKIHGSCNFITDDLSSDRAQLTNLNASSIECAFTTLPIQNLEDRLRDRFSTYKLAVFPVLGLYSPNKPSIVAPAKLQKLRNILAERICRATVVVLIGVKHNPLDPHLWKPVMQSQASKIMYVGSKIDFKSLKKIQKKTAHVAETFEAGVPPILRKLGNY